VTPTAHPQSRGGGGSAPYLPLVHQDVSFAPGSGQVSHDAGVGGKAGRAEGVGYATLGSAELVKSIAQHHGGNPANQSKKVTLQGGVVRGLPTSQPPLMAFEVANAKESSNGILWSICWKCWCSCIRIWRHYCSCCRLCEVSSGTAVPPCTVYNRLLRRWAQEGMYKGTLYREELVTRSDSSHDQPHISLLPGMRVPPCPVHSGIKTPLDHSSWFAKRGC